LKKNKNKGAIYMNKKYQVVYADPPWAYKQQGKTARGIANNNYPTMSTQDICNLDVRSICSDDAILFVWATFPNIDQALKVIDAWGFAYKTAAFVWVKKNKKTDSNFWGMGSYTRANAEICLLGVSPKTKPSLQIKDHGVHQIIESPIETHSKKPDIVRDKIVRLCGDVSRVELFARQKVDGWDIWGNELENDIAIGGV
jgi:N6-adenosine-specific RNA methylase IME4